MNPHHFLLNAAAILTLSVSGARAGDDIPVTAWKHLSSQSGDLPKADLGNQVAALVEDIDKDGYNDFVIASYEKMAWFRYAPATQKWSRYLIEAGMPPGSMEAGGDFYDINGDGAPDIVMGSAWKGKGCLWWWENPYPHFAPDTPWKRHLIAQIGGQHHDQVFGDFAGEGKAQLVFWNNPTGELYLAHIPSDPTGLWEPKVIAKVPVKNGHAEGLTKADINGDGKLDIVGGGWWFEHVEGDTFKAHPIDPEYEQSRSAVGQLIKGGWPEVVLNSGDGVGPLKMYQWDGINWVSRTLVEKMDNGHTLQIADLNGDGNMDIYATEMYDPGPKDQCKSYIFYGDGKGNFRTEILCTGIGSHESKVGDLNGDGKLDILQKDFQHEHRVDVWLNQGTETNK